ncbi:MAG: hypothetical protein M3169_06185 [Candidatus Eremiobacteraeota bacterium]|nr:hypothetical protein [Candidatus Eremiobacteraeota bacterium]
MLTLQMPMLLALLGTALMAVVIFAPARVAAPVTTSFAPPPTPPAMESWEPTPAIDSWTPPPAFDSWEPLANESAPPAWPTLIDRRAATCDVAGRLGLVEALVAVRTPWSEAILRRALDDEPDPEVHAAVAAALSA